MGVNRDVNKVQEILVDEHDGLHVEIPLDGWKSIVEAAKDIGDKIDKVLNGEASTDYEQYLLDQKEKYAELYGEETAEDGVVLGNQLIASIQSGSCPVAFNWKNFKLRNLLISEAYADEAVLAGLTLCVAAISVPPVVLAIAIGVALGAMGAALWNGLTPSQKELLYKFGYVYKDGVLKDKSGKVVFAPGGATGLKSDGENGDSKGFDKNKDRPDDIGSETDSGNTDTWPTPPVDGELTEGEPSRSKPKSRGEKSIYDEDGGEWRPHIPDAYHPEGHWNYKPPGVNSQWENVDNKGIIMDGPNKGKHYNNI